MFRLPLTLLLFATTSLLHAEEAEVRAVLEKNCFGCHGPKKQKGKLRLDTLSTDFVGDRAAAEIWHDALDQIQQGEMPPEDEPQPTSKERGMLVDWIGKGLEAARQSTAANPAERTLRRLNRAEYQNTMTDLLGVDLDFSADLPPDPISPDGFLNNGQSLGMSGLQLETYLATARHALSYALVEGEQPLREVRDPSIKNPRTRFRVQVGENRDRLGRAHYWLGGLNTLQKTGPFTIRVTARAERTEDQPIPILTFRYGYTVAGLTTSFVDPLGEIEISSTESKVYEVTARAETLPQPSENVAKDKLTVIVALFNALDDGQPDPKPTVTKEGKKKITTWPEDPDFPKIIIEKVEVVANDHPVWPPESHRQIVPRDEMLETAEGREQILENFLTRAWRRPPTSREMKTWTAHYESLHQDSDSPISALREVLSASLSSNQFLYLDQPAGESDSLHELATRLSYFLWSSMPDDELRRVAADASLKRPEVLSAQFQRMMADSKSDRFIHEFATQWLDLDGIDRIAIDPNAYPDFDNALKPDFAAETRAFFEEILRTNESALQFLDADFTMANARLARHYGFESDKLPKGLAFERVALNGRRPGGFLGQGALHLVGSDGVDTHPIKRAVWILDRLLHDPPAPPPPDVPDLDEVKNFDKLTVRQQLEVHREKEACADCHKGIDPWGVALEHFDAVGLYREEIGERSKSKRGKNQKPVEAASTLPNGIAVAGVEDLKAYLLKERQGDFAEAFVVKMLTYALGRSLDFTDQPLVDELTKEWITHDMRIAFLMEKIASSDVFAGR